MPRGASLMTRILKTPAFFLIMVLFSNKLKRDWQSPGNNSQKTQEKTRPLFVIIKKLNTHNILFLMYRGTRDTSLIRNGSDKKQAFFRRFFS